MLKHNIDKTKADGRGHLVLLQQRTFLLHWGLFVLFNLPEPEELDAKAPKLDPKAPRIQWALEFSELFFPQQSSGNRVVIDCTVLRLICIKSFYIRCWNVNSIHFNVMLSDSRSETSPITYANVIFHPPT